MKVIQLIRKLEMLNSDLPVMVDGYEGGIEDLEKVEQVFFERDAYAGWSYHGRHREAEIDDSEIVAPAVLLSRGNR